jgi:hypothetical protein
VLAILCGVCAMVSAAPAKMFVDVSDAEHGDASQPRLVASELGSPPAYTEGGPSEILAADSFASLVAIPIWRRQSGGAG